MSKLATTVRRTTADDIFDMLHGQITSFTLVPGTKISEVEIAKQFDVSRGPVREAFIRLANLDLLMVRPQKATVVRRFSSQKIQRARFVRLAIECEVLRRACAEANFDQMKRFDQDLAAQESAVQDQDVERFHALDYDFHKRLCETAGCALMFDTILENKSLVDRLCMLSLAAPAAMDELLDDHRAIVTALQARDECAVLAAIRVHLSRLDEVIAEIRRSHENFFED